MSDMDAVTAAKSDQINADDLVGTEMKVTIEDVIIRAGTEQPITVKLVGYDKVFRPCKTVARIMKAAWGPDSAVYKGRSMLLYRDDSVTWGGMKVGGIRVRALTNISAPLVIALQEKKGSRKMTTVQPLKVERAPDELTPEAAEHSLRTAATLDDLKAVWMNKAMKPFREKLQPVLDERKAELTPANTDAAEVAAMYRNATTPEDITTVDMAANKLALHDDITVANARSEAVAAMGDGQ